MSNWKEGNYKAVYDSHSKSLSDLHGGVALAQLQLDLLKNARYDMLLSLIAHFPYTFFTTSIHAGALFEPLTGLGKPRPGALDVSVEEAPPLYTDPGVSKLNPVIEISLEP